MDLLLKIAIIIILVYIFFFLMPGICAFFVIFGRRECKRLNAENIKGTYYESYAEEIFRALEFIDGLKGEEVCIEAQDKNKLSGVYVDGGFERTVLLAHGYKADPLSQMAYVGQEFYKQGYNLLFIYQRAHGKSGGKHTGMGLLEQNDILDWISYLKKMSTKQIVLYGMSMGAAAIDYTLDRLDTRVVRAVVSDCGFLSVKDQIRNDCKKWHIPWFTFGPAMWLAAKAVLGINIHKSTKEALESARVPVLIVHGMADESVPYSSGLEEFKYLNSEKDFLGVKDAKHTVSMLAGGKGAIEHLFGFVNKYVNEGDKA